MGKINAIDYVQASAKHSLFARNCKGDQIGRLPCFSEYGHDFQNWVTLETDIMYKVQTNVVETTKEK